MQVVIQHVCMCGPTVKDLDPGRLGSPHSPPCIILTTLEPFETTSEALPKHHDTCTCSRSKTTFGDSNHHPPLFGPYRPVYL